ncbi:MAG TPA: DUF4231 domain-containing protein [Leptolyngbyaceae cyanobacterium M65_K2018_010]|nr:DUF4231 domain-containing protein [Leptolyngbyaceae cyanobacterium M65_K2018_010]
MTQSSPEPASPSTSNAEIAIPREPDPISVDLLKSAWERHEVFSANASKAQARFLVLERLLGGLGVLVVFLAVTQPIIQNQVAQTQGVALDTLKRLSLQNLIQRAYWGLAVTTFLLILIPILMTGLRAFSVKFSRGNSWVLLRGSAEAIKMAIFYYRTGIKPYDANRNALLAEQLNLVSERLKGSAAHQKALTPYENQGETQVQLGIVLLVLSHLLNWVLSLLGGIWEFLFGFKEVPVNPTSPTQASPPNGDESLDPKHYGPLDPEGYIRYRLEDQFDWYRRKAKSYDRQYQVLQTSVYIFGGFGTLLAAIGFQSWVAVTAALAAVLINYLEYRRVEVTLVGYNQAADALYDIRTWWYSLNSVEKADPTNFEKLVTKTEETIRSEHSSWLQDMQDRLASLYEGKSEGQPSAPGETHSAHTANSKTRADS